MAIQKVILKKDINYNGTYYFAGSEFPLSSVTQHMKDLDFFIYVNDSSPSSPAPSPAAPSPAKPKKK